MYLDRLFELMAERQASDLFISCGAPLSGTDGVVMALTNQPMDIDTVHGGLYELMNEEQARTFESEFRWNLYILDPAVGNFRINVFRSAARSPSSSATSAATSRRSSTASSCGSYLVMEKRGYVLIAGARPARQVDDAGRDDRPPQHAQP